jgi:signal transduction histidine kinase
VAGAAVREARLYREAQEAVRARDEFLSIAAHELRTPVTGIKGYAELLQRAQARGALDQERLERALSGLGVAADRLAALTGDLLDVSRLRLGRLPFAPGPLDLAALVREGAERLGQRGGAHPLLLDVPDGDWMVEADAGRVEQVLANLLDNAVKYSPDGGPITLRMRREGDGVRLEVRDQGIGLSPGAEEAIFEPFGRGANAARAHIPGMGLGLHICRGIVERHGGRIWASSAGEGQGTTFAVWLPAQIPTTGDTP